MQELINAMLEVEKEAEIIITQAEEAGRKIREDAKKEAGEITLKSRQEAVAKSEQIIEESRNDARKKREKAAQAAAKEVDKEIDVARNQIDMGIHAFIENITENTLSV